MKPNIFFLNLDSIRSDKFIGKTKTAITPNLDKLIKNGTYFSQCISSGDGTVISLNAIFNAQFPFRIGTRAETIILKNNNCFETLKKSGYKIYGFVPDMLALTKFLNYCENENAGCRFIRQRKKLDMEGILDGLGEKVIELLDSSKMKEPWFFFTHAEDLHFPLAVPKEFDNEKFGDSSYERVLSALDQWIGNFLEKIDTSNTLILISGDHGRLIPFENKGTRDFEPKMKTGLKVGKKIMPKLTHKIGAKMIIGLRNNIRDSRLKKANEGLTPYQIRSRLPHTTLSLYEEIVHVPLFFAGVNIPKNKIIHDLVRSVDIFPTIFNILGIDDSTLKDKDGRSLVPMLEDKKLPELSAYFITNPHKEITLDDKIGIRTSKHKYFRASIDKEKEINLYELENDPQENNNIASENPEIVKEMEGILEKLTKNVTIDESEKLTEDQEKIIEKQLKEMGYI